jgi:phosphoribosyl 1,2-cyclic phosphodiesterase
VRVTILGSGSEGNSLLVESEGTSVLVDAGLSYRKLVQRFDAIGREPPSRIAAVLITHSHSDHCAHASTYASRFDCPVRATENTMRALRLKPSVASETFAAGRSLRIGDIAIGSHEIPHDAPQVALRFETRATSVALVTDLGHVPKGLAGFVRDCETLLLESNHDADLLETGPYPTHLKRRVGGALGHLSNAQAGDLLAEVGGGIREVVLMHLSETNNSPHLARCSADAALGHGGAKLQIARQREPLVLDGPSQGQLQLAL